MHFPPGRSAICRKEPAVEREVSDLPAPSLVEPGQKHPSAGLHGSRSGFISEQWLLRPALDLRWHYAWHRSLRFSGRLVSEWPGPYWNVRPERTGTLWLSSSALDYIPIVMPGALVTCLCRDETP